MAGVNELTASYEQLNMGSTHFVLVGEFHDIFGHPLRTEPYMECFTEDKKIVPFRISLIIEELNEFKEALSNKDLKEMADALCDMSYVINGAGHCLGLNIDKDVVHRNYDITTKAGVHVDNLYLQNNVFDIPNDNFVTKAITNMQDIIKCIEQQYIEHNICNMEYYLVCLLNKVYSLGYSLGFNMDLMFREVHRSNMTKVCSNIEDANKSVEIYKNEGRYAEPSIKIKGQYYVVYDAKTSKILKNYKWEVPNVSQFF
jgi:predicted HAD superfamily Cof-like phosphohydrolase